MSYIVTNKRRVRCAYFIITDHDYQNVLDISSAVILMDNGNTRIIREPRELIQFGYLPASAEEIILDGKMRF